MVNYKNEKAEKIEWRVKKSDKPAPGTYKDLELALKHTKERTVGGNIGKGKRQMAVAQSAEFKKGIPGPDHYKYADFRADKVYVRKTSKRHWAQFTYLAATTNSNKN